MKVKVIVMIYNKDKSGDVSVVMRVVSVNDSLPGG